MLLTLAAKIPLLTDPKVAMYNLSMYVGDVIWLPDVLDKLDWKHQVSPAEVENILFGQPLHRKIQRGHIPGEDVYAAFGRTDAGRYLVYSLSTSIREKR